MPRGTRGCSASVELDGTSGDEDGLDRPAATKMSWAEPVETPAGLREPRAAADFPRTAGLREPRTAADFPRTAGWASRERRRSNPANGRPRSAAGGGGAPSF